MIAAELSLRAGCESEWIHPAYPTLSAELQSTSTRTSSSKEASPSLVQRRGQKCQHDDLFTSALFFTERSKRSNHEVKVHRDDSLTSPLVCSSERSELLRERTKEVREKVSFSRLKSRTSSP